MAKCDICQKSGQSGNNVSHSKRHTRTRWHANVQKATIYVNGEPKEWLTYKEVVARTSISVAQLHKMQRAGTFPYPKAFTAQKRMFAAADILAWEQSRPSVHDSNVPELSVVEKLKDKKK